MRACDIENRRVIMSTLNDEKIKGYLYREYGVETTSIPRNNELRIHFKSVRRNSEPYTAAKQVKSLFKPLGNVWENIKSNLYGSELVLVFNRRNSEEISHNLNKLKGGKERWMQRHDLDEDAKLEAYEALEEFRSRNIPDALMSVREGNQYFANGEVFPTYEDARNELEREEELNTQNESPFQTINDSSFQQEQQNTYFQVKNIFRVVDEIETKLKSVNKTINTIGSEKKVNEVLKRAGLDAELRKQFISLVNDNPSLKSLKISEVLSSYLREFVKESDRQYYKAIEEPLSEELENILIEYFDRFKIRRQEIDNLKEKFGVDSVGVFDVLAKTVYYAKNRNLLTLPEEYGHVFVELLGSISNKKADNPLFTYLFNNIDKWDGYQRVFRDYKNLYVTKEGNIDIYKIKKEAIGQAIGIALVRNYKVQKGDTGFWAKVQEVIDYILDLIKGIDHISLNTTVDSIAKDIINKNYDKLDRMKKDTSNYNLLSYSETIKNQNKIDGGQALKFMQWFSEKGMLITGSLAYRHQGTTYRPEIDALHDIDNIVPSDVHKVSLNKADYLTPEQLESSRLYHKHILEGNYAEAKKYKLNGNIRLNIDEIVDNIEVLQELKKQFPETEFLYSFYNEKANAFYITINAIWSKNQELKDRFKSYRGSFNNRLENFTKEEIEQIYLFDFFLRPESSEEYVKIEDSEFGLSLAHFNYSFYEKLNMMGRPKDAFDYQMWDYYEESSILPPDFNDRLVYFQIDKSKQKQQTPQNNIQQVNELFESNPELANEVYKALGFNKSVVPNKIVSINNTNFGDETPNSENELSFNLKDIQIEEFNDIVRSKKATVYFSVPIDKTISFGERANNTIAHMMLHKDGNIVTISSVAIYSPNFRVGEKQLKVNEGKGIGKYIYELLGDKLLNEQNLILKSDASMSIGAQKVWEYLVKNNKAEKAQDGRYYYKNNQITPQQKQQARQIYSQYLESLDKPNTNPILQGNQQEQVKKFAELQERLNNKEFLEGAKNAFESSEELQELGTQEQYNDYIARVSLGIIKNPSSGEYNYESQVKDIVYHFGEVGKNGKFKNDFAQIDSGINKKGFQFATSIKTLLQYGISGLNKYLKNGDYDVKQMRLDDKLQTVLLNTTNPFIDKNLGGDFTESNDAYARLDYNNNGKYIVFEPEQIHILGSKRDVEGFKNWVNNNQTSPKTFSPNYLFTKDWNIKVPEVILETNDSNSDFNLSCIKK